MIGLKGAWVNCLVEPNELLIGLWGGGKLFHLLEILAGGGGNTNFLGNLAAHGGVIILKGVYMATDAGGPSAGLSILGQRSFLQQETAVGMKDPKMDGPMK